MEPALREPVLRIGLRAEVLPGPIQLEVRGCLTAATVGALLRVLVRSMALDGCPGITIDLRDVDELEPAALLALEAHVSAHEQARRILGRDRVRVLPAISVHAPPPCRAGADPPAVTVPERTG